MLTATQIKRVWSFNVCPKVTLAEAIAHLNQVVILGESYSPGPPMLSLDLGTVLTRLGNPALCAVATFQLPGRFEHQPSGTGWVDSPSPHSHRQSVDSLSRLPRAEYPPLSTTEIRYSSDRGFPPTFLLPWSGCTNIELSITIDRIRSSFTTTALSLTWEWLSALL